MSERQYIQNEKVLGERALLWNIIRRTSDSAPEMSMPSLKFLIVAAFCEASVHELGQVICSENLGGHTYTLCRSVCHDRVDVCELNVCGGGG